MQKTILYIMLAYCLAMPLTAQNDDLFWVQTGGPKDTFVSNVAADTCGNVWAAANAGLFNTNDQGKTWKLHTLFRDSIITSVMILPDGIILAGSRDAIYKSSDCGINWEELRGGNLPRIEFHDLACDKEGILYASTGGIYGVPGYQFGVYSSKDIGVTWELTCIRGWDAFAVAVHPNGNLYGGFGFPTGIVKSEDRGETCEQVLDGMYELKSVDVHDLAVSSQGYIYAATSFIELAISKDMGKTWEITDGNGKFRSAALLAVMIDPNDNIYLGSSGVRGTFRSTDGGQSWDALPGEWGFSNEITNFAIDSSGYVYASTQSGGVYRSRYPTLATDVSETPFPTAQATLSATPNPFNDAARITYTLPRNGYIRLSITDALGRIHSSFDEGARKAGTHSARLSGYGLPAGVYFCRLEFDGVVTGMRLLLLR